MQLRRILVPLAGTSVDPDVIRVAVALAKPKHAEVIAIHVIEVRWNLEGNRSRQGGKHTP